MIQLSSDYEVTEDGRIQKKTSRPKMLNIKTSHDDVVFDSGLEAQRYLALKDMQDRGEICRLVLQPHYLLQEGFRDVWGTRHRPITYRADFEYYLANGYGPVIEDTKGYNTPEFAIKEKMFRHKWPELDFRVGDEIYDLSRIACVRSALPQGLAKSSQ